MRKLRCYIDYMKEEISDAKKYLLFAEKAKVDDSAGASLAVKLAEQEMQHAKEWHEVIVAEIDRHKRMLAERGQEVPPMMLEWWKDEHAEYVEKFSKLKHWIEMLKQ